MWPSFSHLFEVLSLPILYHKATYTFLCQSKSLCANNEFAYSSLGHLTLILQFSSWSRENIYSHQLGQPTTKNTNTPWLVSLFHYKGAWPWFSSKRGRESMSESTHSLQSWQPSSIMSLIINSVLNYIYGKGVNEAEINL